ncbi:NAD(P)-binding protein [Gordonia pseudamarae]|jgi:phytoene dehydrogenase-like protein|uniref:NAD(P)-binding protein n=1 Tax=Gordonia pseudamarae TaxID=2831662 RepID=A0ABX6IPN8_9ACTN|nr:MULTISPECIES: NAD(P)/FAD-dependent oxidoreductase [Gordonia]MBD0022233.1 NAD(P)/FAD-dependent oxidoreductase [Gordonia sp. (in: high G+C Gram-positive bacteria)]QHN28245.1 NAD(P)-binding protein [Gordonia pseudamarae]QHN37105.1 NAD(P)-binding protein [Gordonia pseudamarae]
MNSRSPSTAVVVGSGPNGLAGAVVLARAGLDVTVVESAAEIGGGTRSFVRDGLLHDHCSSVHPLGAGSPAFAGLERHGLRWAWPDIDCAHPFDDGSAAALFRDIDRTASGFGGDGRRWRRFFGPFADDGDDAPRDRVGGEQNHGVLYDDVFGPMLRVPDHPLALARFAMRAGLPAMLLARTFRDEHTRGMFAGIAAHAATSLTGTGSSAPGVALIAAGHRNGWPVAVGGSRAISDALVAELSAHGGRVETGVTITDFSRIDADVTLLDVAPRAALGILGDRVPPRVRRSWSRSRRGPAAFAVRLVIDGDIPWRADECRRAGTIHLGGSAAQIAAAEADCAAGVLPARPFTILTQQYLADPTRLRNPPDQVRHALAYAHVPHGCSLDGTEIVLGQIERFAPGVRDRIIDVESVGPAALERFNPNNVGGDIGGGANDLRGLLARPRLSPDPYATGVPGVYLCSSSTAPGGGVHGMCGYRAAHAALRARRR